MCMNVYRRDSPSFTPIGCIEPRGVGFVQRHGFPIRGIGSVENDGRRQILDGSQHSGGSAESSPS